MFSGANRVGGLVGSSTRAGNFPGTDRLVPSGIITNSYATATVSGTGDDVGGLVGRNDFFVSIANSYATGSVDGADNVGGLVGLNRTSGVHCHYHQQLCDRRGYWGRVLMSAV